MQWWDTFLFWRSFSSAIQAAISNANLPSPDIDAQIPEWKVYQNPNDKGDPFFRYVRYGLVVYGKCSHVGVGRVEVSYVRPVDPSLTHVDHRSSANSAMIVNITGVDESFDGLYRVKLIASEAKFRHEALANNILARITKHGAFCTHSFAFRCRLIDPDGVDQCAIAVKLEDAISLKQAREGDMTLSELEILLGLNFLLEGRISVDTRAQPQGEGIQLQWAHGDLHERNILIWRKPSGGFRRFAFIDFANSDIIYTERGVTQRLFGGRGKRKKDGELKTPSGVMETNELVGIFRCLLTSRRYEDSAKFLAELRDSCTLTSIYAAVKMRINEVQNAAVQSSAKA